MYKFLIVVIVLSLLAIVFLTRKTIKNINKLREMKSLGILTEKNERYKKVIEERSKAEGFSSLSFEYSEFNRVKVCHEPKALDPLKTIRYSHY